VDFGIRANLGQVLQQLLQVLLVGMTIGMMRNVVPALAESEFGVPRGSFMLLVAFIVAFGFVKGVMNFVAGRLAERIGRRAVLIGGWLVAAPVPFLLIWAPSWAWVLLANVLLGVSQGLTWSTTVIMKIDLVGPARRGLAMGLNEAAGYLGVAAAAFASGALAATYAPRTVIWVGAAVIAATGLLISVFAVRDTSAHVEHEQATYGEDVAVHSRFKDAFLHTSLRDPVLRACSQAGLVNNLNDALAWGLVPLFLAAHGASAAEIGLVAGIYPAVWGIGQIWTGHWSDRTGR